MNMDLEMQSDTSYISNDAHFEIIQNKLDKLMQIVTMTEKKPSLQMEQLLQLNDNEDEMKLYSKQVNLELQSIVNEQNEQLNAYRNKHFNKQIQCEQILMQEREYLYTQNKKLNDTLKYLAKENLNARVQYHKLTQNNKSLINFIKNLTQDQLSQTIQQQLEQLSIINQNDILEQNTQIDSIEIKQQKKIIALERFLVQVLKSFKNNDEREELLNVKNQLEQKIIEMLELNEQHEQIKKDNKNYMQRLKQAGLLDSKNSRDKNQFVDNFPLKRNGTRNIQTRGKKINNKEIIKEFDENIDDSEENENSDLSLNSSQYSSEQKVQQSKNQNIFKTNPKLVKYGTKNQNTKNEYDYTDSDESINENHKQKSNNQSKKIDKKKSQKIITDSDNEDIEEDNSEYESKKKQQKKQKNKIHNRNEDSHFDKEDDSDFDVSITQNNDNSSNLYQNQEESDEDSSDYEKRKKQKKVKSDKKLSNKIQKTQVPEKKKVTTQNKKKPNKVLLKKQQQNQDRLFNQLDMMLDM